MSSHLPCHNHLFQKHKIAPISPRNSNAPFHFLNFKYRDSIRTFTADLRLTEMKHHAFLQIFDRTPEFYNRKSYYLLDLNYQCVTI